MADTKEHRDKDPGVYDVHSYDELVDITAFLSVMNKTLVPLFRGQAGLYPLQPTLFRPDWAPPIRGAGRESLAGERRTQYWLKLKELGDVIYPILDRLGLPRHAHLEDPRYREPARWAVIQHYELWPTPLLDFTTSLRVAASFAFGLEKTREEAYLYILGVERILSDLMYYEGDDLAIRLNSVCPPSARRPHLQEGVLVGRSWKHGPISDAADTLPKSSTLIATLRLRNPDGLFWRSRDFPMHRKASLLPGNRRDPLLAPLRAVMTYT